MNNFLAKSQQVSQSHPLPPPRLLTLKHLPQIGCWQGARRPQLRLGRRPRLLHRRHLLVQHGGDALLFEEGRERNLKTFKLVALDSSKSASASELCKFILVQLECK